MRISDWSSDVCSSDLGVSIQCSALATLPGAVSGAAWLGVMVPQLPCELPQPAVLASSTRTLRPASSSAKALASPNTPPPTTRDRTRDVQGKRVSARVDHGGRRIITNNKQNKPHNYNYNDN